MNDQSLRPGEANQLRLKTTPFFPREKEELPQAGYEPVTFCILGRVADALPTEPLRQLSWQAESLNVMQGQRHLFPDKQGNSISVL